MLLAAIFDLRSYRIPNWISIWLVALFLFAVLAAGLRPDSVLPHIVVGMVGLMAGYLLYAFTGMGAGDAKLGAAALLWSGLSGLYAWTFFLALSMAALAVSLVVARWTLARTGNTAVDNRLVRRGAPVPLGVALSAASLLASSEFNRSLW